LGERFLALSDLGLNGSIRWIGGTIVVLLFGSFFGGLLSVPFLILGRGISMTGAMQRGDLFLIYIGINVTFVGLLGALWIVVRFVHRRPFVSLINPSGAVSFSRIGQGFLVWLVILVVLQVGDFALHPSNIEMTFDPVVWIKFLPLALLLTPLQTWTEELIFRGYILQGLGRLIRIKPVLILANGMLFALPHLANPEITKQPDTAVVQVLNYILIGAGFAWFVLRDNRLELAMGAHLANNLFVALFVNYANSALETPAILNTPQPDPVAGLVTLVPAILVFYYFVFHVLDRRGRTPIVEPIRPDVVSPDRA
jgi:membrane protease YdiL (CAAX protease family)